MTKQWCAFLLLLGSAWTVAGCSKVKPGLGVQVNVQGNVAPGERATRIDLVFDRPMVATSELGKELRLTRKLPFRIEPEVPGVARWREDRTLSFEPKEALPRSTRFVVTVPEGTHAVDDVGFTDDFEFAFETERLTLKTQFIHDFTLPDPKRWAVFEQGLQLRFNQPVASAALVASCGYHSADGKLRLALHVNGDGDAAREHFEVKPKEPLGAGQKWRFQCDASLRPVEGPLTLQQREGEGGGNGEAPDGALEFETFGPFKVERVTPAGPGADPDIGQVSVHFTNPPALVDGRNPITIEPQPGAVSETAYTNDAALITRVTGLMPLTDYTVKVPAGLKDAFGQTLEQPFSGSFRTGEIQPGYALDTGSWVVESTPGDYVAWTRNVKSVEVRAASLTQEQLFKVLPALQWWDNDPVDLKGLNIPVVSKTLSVSGNPNVWNQLRLDPKELFGAASAAGRFYYIASRSPEVSHPYETDDAGRPLPQPYQEVLVNVTNLGITSKLAGNSGLVWVTRLSDGAVQPAADVLVRDRNGTVLWSGKTDERGVARLPGRAALRAKLPKRTDVEQEEHGWGSDATFLVFARVGDDVTFVDPDHVGRFAPWSLGLRDDPQPNEYALRGFLHTDRGLYRPGETVHVKGLARLLKLGGSLFVPPDAQAELVLSDPRGQEVLRQSLPLSRFGGFSLDHVLPETAALGDYRLQAVLPHGNFFETFTVEEYRAATFEVKLTSKEQETFAGGAISLGAFGQYFYGAPVRSADVTFRVHTRARDVNFTGYEQYAFEDESHRYDSVRPYGEEAFITEQALKLDERGNATLHVPLPAEQIVSASTLLISATVSDQTNQTVSANLSVPLHRTRLYLGVDTGGWVAEAKKPQKVRFAALSPAGKPVAAKAKYTLLKQTWSCAWERWGYLGSYRCTSKEENIQGAELSLGAAGPFEQTVTFPSPGEYVVVVEGKDETGALVKAARSIWVWGDGESAWRADDSGRFEIIADKKEYKVGDVAKLIVQTPTRGAKALISVERDGVMSERVLSNLVEGQAIEVPITAEFAPNAFVSVLLSRGRSGEGPRGLPQTTLGVIDLPVSHADKRLRVEVNTDQKDYRPGSPVTARLRVTDVSGTPVQAEVALAAADEGVLSLIGFRTPDPIATFFAPWGLGVRTASQFERLAQVPAPGQDRYVTGGDSAGPPGSFRSRFRSTAYWNPAVLTDIKGEAEVTFEAPDNLTAFRLMAVAADATDRFGSGDKRFQVNKPVQLISALPRFASVGDEFEAAVMLTNETGAAGSAKVSFQVNGAVSAKDAAEPDARLEKTVQIPAGGRERIAFAVAAKNLGSARFRFAASLGQHSDGLELRIPVHYPTSEEGRVVSQGDTQASVTLPVAFPDGVLPASARLELSVDPDGLAGIEESLRDLVQYPYGCLEQTTSRLIPLVSVRELSKHLDLKELQGEALERYIRVAIAKIFRHQTSSGGFSLWPGSQPEAYLTAYALWGLKLAKDAGYALDERAVEEAVGYLKRELSSDVTVRDYHSEMGELASRAFALHVLSLLNRPEPGLANALLAKADTLPRYGQAFLARALAAAVGPAHASVTGLVSRWQSSPTGKGDGVWVQETGQNLDWYFSSHLRTSAIVTDTLLALRPADPQIPRLVRGLLNQRRDSGSWYTTQENLYALVALTNYAKAWAGKTAAVKIERGGETLLEESLAGQGVGRIRHVSLPVDPKDARPLSVTATQGTVHYRVRLRYRRDKDHQPGQQNGLVVRRVFLDPETGATLERAKEGQMVRVQLTLDSNEQRNHIALSDYLPAGLEPINTRFVTAPSTLPKDDPDWSKRLWLVHRELHDERVDAFANWMEARPSSFEYLARATTVGRFVLPAATVEEMYDPDVNARTPLGSFEVVPR